MLLGDCASQGQFPRLARRCPLQGQGRRELGGMPVADHARMVGCATAVSIVWRKRRDARGFFLVWCGCVLCLVEFHLSTYQQHTLKEESATSALVLHRTQRVLSLD